ncbi:esterase B1-like [Teleopsis dalmanni]|uniref:esterase B1-like n=2 Tax=Teleopsis dalmanni TaxID=139649 RepID=UPI0018CF113C|nr:esterase B1-like [Teleopsis dalmanni]
MRLKLDETVTVNTQSGKIKGAKRRTIYNDVYCSFEKIPYAQPPVGELRFRAPKPVVAWKHVRDCTHFGESPFQHSVIDRSVVGAEDCLFLNVYTNNIKPSKPRPVMVWIYGGGFRLGEASRDWYAPDYFMKKDVVLVTVQYRLGALGFLSLTDPNLHIPGNAGLKDQILALKWIKRNCSSFGGNPDCITIFGESAGGCSVALLMLTEQTRGLFHRAIAQSGVATVSWGIGNTGKRAFALAKAAGYTGDFNEPKILKYLLQCTAEEITNAQQYCLTPEDMNSMEMLAFGPCVEPYMTQHTVLLKPTEELFAQTWSNSVPLLLGSTSSEGLLFKPILTGMPEFVEQILKNFTSLLPPGTFTQRDSPEALEKASKLRAAYIEGNTASLEVFYDVMGHLYFWHPLQKTINLRLQHAKKAPTYLYRYDFDSEKLIYPFRYMWQGRGVRGVAHADELAYLFHSVLGRPMERNSREYRNIERMIGLWTTFAETGNPNTGKINGMKGIKWRPLRSGDKTLKCLNISDELKFIDLPEMPKLKVWQELYSTHREIPEKTAEIVDFTIYAKSNL